MTKSLQVGDVKIDYEHRQWDSRRDGSCPVRCGARQVKHDFPRVLMEGEQAPSSLEVQPLQIRNILVPTDFSPCTTRALQEAARLAKQHNATITLVYVVDLDMHTPAVGPANADKLRSELRTEGLAKLGQLAIDLAREQVGVRTLIREGLPAEEIADVARTHDLIVIGKGKTNRFCRIFSRRTVETLVTSAPCPVLVIREPQETSSIKQNPA